MGILYDAQNLVAKGGTELMFCGLEKNVSADILDQVFISRSTELLSKKTDKPRIFWSHEVPATPQSSQTEFIALSQKRWVDFDCMVFVSNWQMLEYTKAFNFTWSDWERVRVIQNAIYPIEKHKKPDDKIRLIYTSNPLRGLNVLYKAFEILAAKYDNIELEIFSSFNLYNIPNETDALFAELFEKLKKHPQVVYQGAKSNAEVREAFKRSHIFAYPSTWGETSCLSLIEAMSAGLICVHPNNAALFETAANWTNMYHFEPDFDKHVAVFTEQLDQAIQQYMAGKIEHLRLQSEYIKHAHSWENITKKWEKLLSDLTHKTGTTS
jgi:glycosyltransferase involved in cell wall biosynthesis